MARIRSIKPTFVYVAAQHVGDEDGIPVCASVVKIGVADDPKSRFAALQTGCPYPLLPVHLQQFETRAAAHRAEAMVHGKFRSSRTSGEWFDVGVEAACQAVIEVAQP